MILRLGIVEESGVDLVTRRDAVDWFEANGVALGGVGIEPQARVLAVEAVECLVCGVWVQAAQFGMELCLQCHLLLHAAVVEGLDVHDCHPLDQIAQDGV